MTVATLDDYMTPELFDSLYRVARRRSHGDLEADEVMGQALLRITRGFDKFDPSTGHAGFRTWCMAVLTNTWRNIITARYNAPTLESIPEGAMSSTGWTEATEYGELRHFVDTVDVEDTVIGTLGVTSPGLRYALSVMPQEQVEALLMVTEGYSYKEIAAEQGVTVGTVCSRVKRARTRAQVMLNAAP